MSKRIVSPKNSFKYCQRKRVVCVFGRFSFDFLTGFIFFGPNLDRNEFSFQLFEASIIHVIFSLIPAFIVGKMLTFFRSLSFEWRSFGEEISVLLDGHRKGKNCKYFFEHSQSLKWLHFASRTF